MKLKNNFSTETRWLFHDVQYRCWKCFCNGQDVGGTELNHISGRDSASPVNASVLCKKCHSDVGHSEEEEVYLYKETLKHLAKIGYTFNKEDMDYIESHPRAKKALHSLI